MRKATVALLCLFLMMCLVPSARGGGMSIWAVGAKAKGMGGAFHAIANDWSAAYYNPAGLFYVTKNQVTFNEVITHNCFSYTPSVNLGDYQIGFYEGKIYNRHKILTTPTLGGFFRIPVSGNDFVTGVALFQPFDMNVSWQVFQPLNNEFQLPGQQMEHNFDAIAVNWVGALELMEDRLSVGWSAGLLKADLAYGGFFLRPNPANPDEPYYDLIAGRPNELITEWQHSSGDGLAPNFRAGLLFKATPDLNFGASFAYKTKVTLEGNSYFYFHMPDIFDYHTREDVRTYPGAMNYILSSGARYMGYANFKTEITLPGQLAGGVAYKVTDRLLVAGALEYTFWSQFKGYYFDYTFLDENITRNDTLNVWMAEDMNVPVDWSNTFRGSIGLQYAYSDVVQLRAGYSADQSPASQELDEAFILHPAFFDPGLKHSFSAGLGLVFEDVMLDFATQYISYPETVQGGNMYLESNGEVDEIMDNMAGTYDGSAWESIVQFTVRF